MKEADSMDKRSVPYTRRGLFTLITLPMVLMYFVIGYHLFTLRPVFGIIYCAFFILTIIFQSYNCVYWGCPHAGTYCPGAGGFCVLSSPIADILIKNNIKKSASLYNAFCTVAFIGFLGIILFPMYFIFQLGLIYLISYIAIILLYLTGMMMLICPSCGAKNNCPGGRFSTKILNRREQRFE